MKCICLNEIEIILFDFYSDTENKTSTGDSLATDILSSQSLRVNQTNVHLASKTSDVSEHFFLPIFVH